TRYITDPDRRLAASAAIDGLFLRCCAPEGPFSPPRRRSTACSFVSSTTRTYPSEPPTSLRSHGCSAAQHTRSQEHSSSPLPSGNARCAKVSPDTPCPRYSARRTTIASCTSVGAG